MSSGKILFLVNGNEQIGTGHFWRCFYIGSVLRDRGLQVSFVSFSLSNPLAEVLDQHRYEYKRIQRFDLENLLLGDSSIYSGNARLLVIDSDEKSLHAPQFQQAIIHAGWKLIMFSVSADVEYHCHLYVNPNVMGLSQNLTSAAWTKALIGPRYLTFNRTFEALGGMPEKAIGKKIFICFGGADPCNYTEKLLDFFAANDPVLGLEYRIVVGNLNSRFEKIKTICNGNPNMRLFQNTKEIARIMGECDLAICSPGMVFWELMLLGVKSIILSSSEREKPISRFLGDKKIALAFHDYDEILTHTKLSALITLLHRINDEMFSGFRDVRRQVDTNGTVRIADEIENVIWRNSN